MTITTNSALNQLLGAPVSKTGWCATLEEALTSDRRVIAAHNGSIFRNCALTGAFGIENGNITSLGLVSGTIVASAADLSTGSATLQIDGGGHTLVGSLGLPGSGSDFILSANPTSANGFAFGAISILAPAHLPILPAGSGGSGATAPYYITIEDWTSGSAVDAGDIVPNTAMPNQIFEDTEISANIGTLKVTKSTMKVTHGEIEFGALLYEYHAAVNADADEPVFQFLIGMAPTATNWPGYPSYANYITKDGLGAGSITQPPAFKVAIKRTDGSLVARIDMPKDNLPINDPSLSQTVTELKPLRQFVNCAQLLEWKSARLKKSSLFSKFLPGYEPDVLRPTIFKQKVSTNQAHGIYRTGTNTDSAGQWFAQPKWAYPGQANNKETDPNGDPYLYGIDSESAGWFTMGSGVVRYSGYGYEPGATTGHDMMTGPGGVRVDRAVVPMPLAIYATDPNFIRLKGGETIEDMVENHWMKGYFNHPQHYLYGDVRDFATIPKQEVTDSLWSFSKSYYGTNGSYTSGGLAKAIPQFVMGNGGNTAFTDRNGLKPFSGNGIDMLHNYPCPGWGGLLFNDAGLIYSQVHRYLGSIMCQLSAVDLNTDLLKTSIFNGRQLGWRYLHYGMMWKLASNHPTGISRAMVWERFDKEIAAMHKFVTVPMNDPAHPDHNHQQVRSLRNLGCSVSLESPFFNAMVITEALAEPSVRVKVDNIYHYRKALDVTENFLTPETGRRVKVGPASTEYFLIGTEATDPAMQDKWGSGLKIPGTLIFSTPVQVADATLNGAVINLPMRRYAQATAGQAFYIAEVIVDWRQTGFLAAVLARSQQHREVVQTIIDCLDKLSIDFILETDGREESYVPLATRGYWLNGTYDGPGSVVVDSWAHWSDLRPKVGLTDWITNADGSNKLEVDVSQHNRAQWPFVRARYLSEFPCKRENGIALGCAKYRGFYDTHDARLQAVIDSGASPATQRNNDWTYRMAPLGIPLAATILGPI